MISRAGRWKNIWSNILQSSAQRPITINIPHDHVDEEGVGQPFQPGEHYFQIRINEMYLAYSRQWFSTFDPMVLVVSEFIYDKKMETVPFVVGPTMMKEFGNQIPTGMVFSNTRVAGLHPYRGGRLCLSVVLCRLERGNYAKEWLQVVESVVGALDFSTVLSSYLKIADAVLDGFNTLLKMGTVPLIGLRREFDPDGGDTLESTYFALIDKPVSQLNPDTLWVRDKQLYVGKSLEYSTPFLDADFVLYSIVQVPERSDITMLPFYPLYEQVTQDAMKPDDISWRSAKVNMSTLSQRMVLSPDLTPGQADKLSDQYIASMQRMRKKAVDESVLGEGEKPTEIEKKLHKAISILDL